MKKFETAMVNKLSVFKPLILVGCFGLTAICDSISVYFGPSPREKEKEMTNDRRE